MEENNFSTFIKELRMEKGLSQEELAKALYVHRTTVNKWENDNVIPLNDKLLLIANYFDISVDELLNGKRSDINHASLVHHIQNALRANYFMHRDVDYVVSDDKIVIVDQFTGRLMKLRTRQFRAKISISYININTLLFSLLFY